MGWNVLALRQRGRWVTSSLGIAVLSFLTSVVGLPNGRVARLVESSAEAMVMPQDWIGMLAHLGLVILLVMVSGLYAG